MYVHRCVSVPVSGMCVQVFTTASPFGGNWCGYIGVCLSLILCLVYVCRHLQQPLLSEGNGVGAYVCVCDLPCVWYTVCVCRHIQLSDGNSVWIIYPKRV